MPRLKVADGSSYTVDEVISETQTHAVVRIGEHTYKLTKQATTRPDWNALADKLHTTTKALRKRAARTNEDKAIVKEATQEATRVLPRNQEEEDYLRKQEGLEASEALMTPVTAQAAINAGATYAVEVESGAGKRTALFPAELKAQREARLARAEAGENIADVIQDGIFSGPASEPIKPKSEPKTVTKTADEADEVLNAIRNATPRKGGK